MTPRPHALVATVTLLGACQRPPMGGPGAPVAAPPRPEGAALPASTWTPVEVPQHGVRGALPCEPVHDAAWYGEPAVYTLTVSCRRGQAVYVVGSSLTFSKGRSDDRTALAAMLTGQTPPPLWVRSVAVGDHVGIDKEWAEGGALKRARFLLVGGTVAMALVTAPEAEFDGALADQLLASLSVEPQFSVRVFPSVGVSVAVPAAVFWLETADLGLAPDQDGVEAYLGGRHDLRFNVTSTPHRLGEPTTAEALLARRNGAADVKVKSTAISADGLAGVELIQPLPPLWQRERCWPVSDRTVCFTAWAASQEGVLGPHARRFLESVSWLRR